ncbi:hypothetical protein LCGC14_2752250, partial [marine sediment metagenome]
PYMFQKEGLFKVRHKRGFKIYSTCAKGEEITIEVRKILEELK